MNDPKPGKNFAVSDGPVNSRLVAPPTVPFDDTAPVVRARLEAARARLRLGATLAERLSPLQHRQNGTEALGTREIVAVVGATVSAVGLTLGLIQGGMLVIGVSAVFTCVFGVAVYLAAKARRQAGGEAMADASDLMDVKDIALLDTAMEKLAATAPQETIDRLSDLKAQISRCVALVASAKGALKAEVSSMPAKLRCMKRPCIRLDATDTSSRPRAKALSSLALKASLCTSSLSRPSMKRSTWSSTAICVALASGTAVFATSGSKGVMTSGGDSVKLAKAGAAAGVVAGLVTSGMVSLTVGWFNLELAASLSINIAAI